MAEQLTLNQWVLGSSPRGRTSKKIPLILRNRGIFAFPSEYSFEGLRSRGSALFLMVRAACFLRAYAGAPVTRTLRPLLAPHRRASVCHPEGASGKRGALPMRRPAPLCICGSGFAESRRFVGVRVGFVCAPCLANWGGGGLSPFSVLRGGWCFACGAGRVVAV